MRTGMNNSEMEDKKYYELLKYLQRENEKKG